MRLKTLSVVLLGTVSGLAAFSAAAADLTMVPPSPEEAMLPAVSGPNGKFELDLGRLSDPSSYIAGAAGSISVPVTDRFGLQGDVMVHYGNDALTYGGALHAFTRDPSSYLLGVTGAAIRGPGATLWGAGPEAELYWGSLSLEMWAGYAALDYNDAAMDDISGGFAFVDGAFYPTDNFRLTLGGSYVLGELGLHAGAEYSLADYGLPLSLTADARSTESSTRATIGIAGYFGSDPDKSLIDRHRQDDPRNRAVDFFGGSGDLMSATNDVVDYGDPEMSQEACEQAGGLWYGPPGPGACNINYQ